MALYINKRGFTVEAYKATERVCMDSEDSLLVAEPGDYVVTGFWGDTYPMKAVYFEENWALWEDAG